ncbi:MAG: CRISPR-associated endonuclease Cas2 [Bacteroidota bacterium]|nr:CRISPR-associated endonuclease Cas2 [Bacteroidota bacterium]
MLTIVVYQIKKDKTRTKLRNLLLNHGYCVLNSVFEFRLTKQQQQQLIKKLNEFEELIEQGDGIRIYGVCSSCIKKAIIIGKNPLTIDPLFYIV